MLRNSIAAAAIAVCIACVGCDENWQTETQPASGSVTINDAPPTGAIIELHTLGQKVDARGSRPWGKVGEDGEYSLTTYQRGDGAPVGTYRVTLWWPADPVAPSPEDRLASRYSEPGRSPWEVTISEGMNRLPPIEIQDTAIATGQQPQAVASPPMPGLNLDASPQ